MNNRDKWRPSKFELIGGRLMGTRDRSELAASSRLMADLIAGKYQHYLQQYARGRLLDLGCGKVPLLLAYEARVQEVTCVDWENTLHKNEYLDSCSDLSKPLDFENDRFDTIILSDVLEHIPNPDLLWREVARIMSKGAKILVNVPFFYWIHEDPHDYYRYTEFALRRFVKDSGLSLVKLESIGGVPEICADLFSKCAQRIPVVGQRLAIAIQWAVSVFLKTGLGARTSRKTSYRFPYGYFLVAEK